MRVRFAGSVVALPLHGARAMLSPRVAALAAVLLSAGCDAGPGDEVDADVCEAAAQHVEACLGTYITPPACDAAAADAAQDVLDATCEEVGAMGDPGKADGAFCDWFGLGCSADEPIFDGPSCTRDRQCAQGSTCIERRCFAGVASPAFSRLMDRWTSSQETAGSDTALLTDNVDTAAVRLEMIESATQTIHFSALMIDDDLAGYETAAAMAAAARRGVDVRVVVDATTQYQFVGYQVLDVMRDAGVAIIPFNPILEWGALRVGIDLNLNQRLHEKLLIVDGERAVLGGRNVGDDYFGADRWRDTDVLVVGPGVADIQRIFLGVWDQAVAWELEAGCPQQAKYGFYCGAGAPALSDDVAFYPPAAPVGTARTRPIYSDPRSQATPLGYRATLNLVRSARASIVIANSYFVPPRRLRKHLRAAVARGVQVTVITNSLQSTDAWWMYYASLNYYKELIRAGVEIRQYRGTETMHAKTMLVDDEVAVIGSFNLDPRSAASNSEAMVLVRDGAAVDELRAAMAIDAANSDVASDDISVADWVKAKAFRLVEPLL